MTNVGAITVAAELAQSFGRAEIPKALAASATTEYDTYFSLIPQVSTEDAGCSLSPSSGLYW